MHVQFYFRSATNFSRAFWPPGAGPSPVQVADNFFISLRQMHGSILPVTIPGQPRGQVRPFGPGGGELFEEVLSRE